MRITSKGQVTIPQHIREVAGLFPETEVEFRMVGDKVILEKKQQANQRGKKLIASMRGKGSVNMTTDEIMKLTRGE